MISPDAGSVVKSVGVFATGSVGASGVHLEKRRIESSNTKYGLLFVMGFEGLRGKKKLHKKSCSL
jgi:hypothetical protein